MPTINPEQYLSALRQVSFSKYLLEDDLSNLLSSCQCISLTTGQILFEENSFKESMFIILDGELEVYKQHKHIAYRGVGEFIGEMSLLESKRRSANVKGATDSILLEIDKDSFNRFIGSNPKIVWDISKTLSQRTREDTNELESSYLKLKRSEEKLRRIVDAVSDLVFQIDPNGNIEFVNESIKTLGYEVDELIGKPFAKIYDGELDKEKKRHIFSRRIGSRSLTEIEFNLKVSPDCSLYALSSNMSYLVSALGLWNVPQKMVEEKDCKKEYLGSLLIARSQLLDLKI
ncbi:MAG: cyclic nucleotide-binding domain-containing protein [Nitrospinae bacterium]|nr:cyclic nucleotide-binding domain-containing protein [Nitrospinota bacterium]